MYTFQFFTHDKHKRADSGRFYAIRAIPGWVYLPARGRAYARAIIYSSPPNLQQAKLKKAVKNIISVTQHT